MVPGLLYTNIRNRVRLGLLQQLQRSVRARCGSFAGGGLKLWTLWDVQRAVHIYMRPIRFERPPVAVRIFKKILGLAAFAVGVAAAFAALTLHSLVVPALALLATGLYWMVGRDSEYQR